MRRRPVLFAAALMTLAWTGVPSLAQSAVQPPAPTAPTQAPVQQPHAQAGQLAGKGCVGIECGAKIARRSFLQRESRACAFDYRADPVRLLPLEAGRAVPVEHLAAPRAG